MQKQILFICTLLVTSLTAMEKPAKACLELTLRSRPIIRVHTQEYLEQLEQKHHRKNELKLLKSDLKLVAAVLNATNDVIQAKQNASEQTPYGISVIYESYYGAGNSLKPKYGDTYAILPIAVAHALKSKLFKRILIIDQTLDSNDPDDLDHYYTKGNGSLFYPDKKKNPKLFKLFNDKIITSDKIQPHCNKIQQEYIDHFLKNDGKNTDLIFYVHDIDRENNSCDPDNYIPFLINTSIPTVFILAGSPREKKYNQAPSQTAIHDISTHVLKQCKSNFCSFDVHYWCHTETKTFDNTFNSTENNLAKES